MQIEFVKMEGAGNDYVYIDATRGQTFDSEPDLARRLADRHFGVGGDGLILIKPATGPGARYRMHMFNADGSEGEMCGNGLRCVAKFLADAGLEKDARFPIQTGAGVKTVEVFKGKDGNVERARIDMGEPILERGRIPMTGPAGERAVNQTIEIDGHTYVFTAVSMGNPHCVIWVDDTKTFPVHGVGPKIEHHPLFPRRVNVEFVEIRSPSHVVQRTWERGSGETLACGTGASAVCVAAVLTGKTGRKVRIDLLGGTLELEWDEKTNHVFKTGPAREVFRGVWKE